MGRIERVYDMRKFFIYVFNVLLFCAFMYSAYVVIKYVLTWIKTNNSLVIPVVSALIGLIGVMYIQWQSKSREIRESHRAKKIEAYMLFFEITELFQNSSRENIEIDISDKGLREKFQQLTRLLILWASDDVIKAWLEFRTESQDSTDPLYILRKTNRMYMAIRKDLGHKDKKLKQLDLIRMNLSNPGELDNL